VNIEEFITGVRTRIETISDISAYSPELPIADDNDDDYAAAVTMLGGTVQNSLGTSRLYNNVLFRVIIRGLRNNDTDIRAMVDSVYDKLNMANGIALTSSKIVLIYADTDVQYIGKDDNERILYNINFRAIIE